MSTTTSDTQTTAISTGEIITTAQLRSEATHAEGVLEEFNEERAKIGEWVGALSDRYVSAEFGTTALTAAVNAVAEAQGQSVQISEALAQMIAALDEADAIGDAAEEIKADGNVDAFKAN